MRQQIYLSNTLSRNVFPDNTSGDFTNVLCQAIPPQHSISVSEVYYKAMGWHNIRPTNNDIIMEFSQIAVQKNPNHAGAFRPETHKVIANIPPGLYTDVFKLMRAIVDAMNHAAVEFFKEYWLVHGTTAQDRRFGYGRIYEWLTHRDLGVPQWEKIKQEININEPRAIQDDYKFVWVIPPEYDPNCVYGRFYYMTIVNNKVRFGRFRDQARHHLRMSFSMGIAQLLGYRLDNGGGRTWQTFERDPLALHYGSDDIFYENYTTGDGRSVRITKKLADAEYGAQYQPNMDAVTMQTLWIMCDGVEETLVDTKIHRPILRALPNNPYNIHHSLHMFGIPQFKRLLSSNGADQLRIRMVENFDGAIVSIYGDVFIRIEVIPNDNVTRV